MRLSQALKIPALALFSIAALSSTRAAHARVDATAIRGETQDGPRAEIDRSVPAAIRRKILEQALKDHPALLECFEAEGKARKEEYLSNMNIEAVDLNRDRQPEFFVEPSGGCDCGAHNCSLWVYRQTATGYSIRTSKAGCPKNRNVRTLSADVSTEMLASDVRDVVDALT